MLTRSLSLNSGEERGTATRQCSVHAGICLSMMLMFGISCEVIFVFIQPQSIPPLHPFILFIISSGCNFSPLIFGPLLRTPANTAKVFQTTTIRDADQNAQSEFDDFHRTFSENPQPLVVAAQCP
jgi:hypothetical protein